MNVKIQLSESDKSITSISLHSKTKNLPMIKNNAGALRNN